MDLVSEENERQPTEAASNDKPVSVFYTPRGQCRRYEKSIRTRPTHWLILDRRNTSREREIHIVLFTPDSTTSTNSNSTINRQTQMTLDPLTIFFISRFSTFFARSLAFSFGFSRSPATGSIFLFWRLLTRSESLGTLYKHR